jgi:hypothetical protein
VSADSSAGLGPSVAPVLRAPSGAPGRRFVCPPSADCAICNARAAAVRVTYDGAPVADNVSVTSAPRTWMTSQEFLASLRARAGIRHNADTPAPAAASLDTLVDNVDRTLRRLLRDLDGIRDQHAIAVIDDIRDQLAADATAARADLNLPPEGCTW